MDTLQMLSLLDGLSGTFFGFAWMYLLLRCTSKEEYAAWVLFFMVCASIEVARSGMIQNALLTYLTPTAGTSEYGEISRASWYINGLLTALSVVVVLICAAILPNLWATPVLRPMFWVYIITTIAFMPLSQFNYIQQANMDFKGIFWGNVVRRGLFFVYILLLYIFHWKVNMVILAAVQAFTTTLAAALSYMWAKPYLKMAKQVSKRWVSELLHFGKYVFGTNLCAMIFKNVDKMILATVSQLSAVSVYDVAMRIIQLLDVPSMAAATVVYPQSAKLSATKDVKGIKEMYEKSVGAILAMILPALIIVILFAKQIVILIASPKYVDSVPILLWSLPFSILYPFSRQCGTILDSNGKPHINFLFVLTSAILITTSLLIFVPLYDIYGVIIGTFIAQIIIFCYNQYFLHRFYKINALNSFYYIGYFYKLGYHYLSNYLSLRFKSAK
ncbi:MAG: oligosaccharide flippase family protein [Sphingobacteriales bacterium]|nr:oligosaccharide flippase family protein [Sphingobacteriales bacterium]